MTLLLAGTLDLLAPLLSFKRLMQNNNDLVNTNNIYSIREIVIKQLKENADIPFLSMLVLSYSSLHSVN